MTSTSSARPSEQLRKLRHDEGLLLISIRQVGDTLMESSESAPEVRASLSRTFRALFSSLEANRDAQAKLESELAVRSKHSKRSKIRESGQVCVPQEYPPAQKPSNQPLNELAPGEFSFEEIPDVAEIEMNQEHPSLDFLGFSSINDFDDPLEPRDEWLDL